MPEAIFEQEQAKLRGMNEHTTTVQMTPSTSLSEKVYEVANVGICPAPNKCLRFAAQTLASSSLVLVTLNLEDNEIGMVVNCEKYVIGSMLLNELKAHIKSSP